MDGLEKIIENIKKELLMECNEIQKEAQSKCKEILHNYEKEAAEILVDMQAQLKVKLENIIISAEHRGEMDGKRKLLNSKDSFLLEVIKESVEGIIELPDIEYNKVLLDLLSRYDQSQEGEILLSVRDKARLNSKFEEEIRKRKLRIVESDIQIEGGFVLKYGEVEENCTLLALLSERQDMIRDKIYPILFQ